MSAELLNPTRFATCTDPISYIFKDKLIPSMIPYHVYSDICFLEPTRIWNSHQPPQNTLCDFQAEQARTFLISPFLKQCL